MLSITCKYLDWEVSDIEQSSPEIGEILKFLGSPGYRAAHNTNVTNLFPPWGGYPKFVQQGLNDDWLPHWLEQAGYSRYYVGKFLNSHTVDNYNAPPVKGWTNSSFLLDPYTYEYYNAVFTHNGGPVKSYKGQYSPDLVTDFALDFLDDAAKQDQPFFIAVAPIAPHGNVKLEGGLEFGYPRYAERHAHLFEDYRLPRDASNFNPKKVRTVLHANYMTGTS